jgi:tripartite-type tricarboxylate transporter receptor subunit TctC
LVVVENRPGVGAIVGAQAVAKAAPDGFTLLLGDINLAVNPALYKTLPYDAKTELTPVSLVASAPLVLVVNAASPYTSLGDLVAAARRNPGKLNFGSAGAGNTTHLVPELLKASQSLDIRHVPYKGAGPAVTDLVSGQIDFVISGVSGVQSLVQAGRLRALAITGDKRAPALPQVPTFQEAGVPLAEAKFGSWWGILAPAGTPRPILVQLNQAVAKALASSDVRTRLASHNIEPLPSTPEALDDWVRAETERWTSVLRNAQIKPE